jgi:hypothetical protein
MMIIDAADVDYREHKSEPQHILHTTNCVRLTNYEHNFSRSTIRVAVALK